MSPNRLPFAPDETPEVTTNLAFNTDPFNSDPEWECEVVVVLRSDKDFDLGHVEIVSRVWRGSEDEAESAAITTWNAAFPTP